VRPDRNRSVYAESNFRQGQPAISSAAAEEPMMWVNWPGIVPHLLDLGQCSLPSDADSC
jgi:hypothetical protein